MKKGSIFIGCGHLIRNIEDFRGLFAKSGATITVPSLDSQQFNESEMIKYLPGHVTAILGDDQVTARVLDASSPTLRAIIKWGIGTDNIDLEASERLGIPVYNTPGQFSGEVAELAIGMMLSLARNINHIDKSVRLGKWQRYEGKSIGGTKAHIVGMGNIGQSIAERLVAFNVDVTGSDPHPLTVSDSFPKVDIQSGVKDADWVFIACALTSENIHIIDDKLISSMKPECQIINVARGALIDEKALYKHLISGHVLGAALDVFEEEPFSPENPLAALPNVLLGSHGGSSTREAIHRVNKLTVNMALKIVSDDILENDFNQITK